MQPGLSTVERAFQLARGGACAGVDEVRAKLKGEGHELVDSHLQSKALRDQLKKMCRDAQDALGLPPPEPSRRR